MNIVALYGHKTEDNQKIIITDIISHLLDNGFSVKIFNSLFSEKIKISQAKTNCISFFSNKKEIIDANLILSIGGDGTFLRAASFINSLDIPILGVNVGRLGFLADLTPDDIPHLADIICNKNYDIEQRIMLQISSEKNKILENEFALNDISIFKRETLGILSIETFINNKYLNTYWSDGLLIATPTGSTAYSLSLGGPIIMPNNKCLIITPMAPHNLTVRPIIIPDDSEIKLKINSRDKNFNISIDTKTFKFQSGTVLTIKKSNSNVKVVKPKNNDYFETLRNKLMWGVDSRNN